MLLNTSDLRTVGCDLAPADSLGDSCIPLGCTPADAAELSGVEIAQHLGGIFPQLRSFADLRLLPEVAEPWLLKACPALLKRYVQVLHPRAVPLREANAVQIDDHKFYFMHSIAPDDPRTLELRLQPVKGRVRIQEPPRLTSVPNVTKIRLRLPSNLTGFDSTTAYEIAHRIIQSGYSCFQHGLMEFVKKTPWSNATSRLYAELERIAARCSIEADIVNDLIFGTQTPSGKIIHLTSPEQIARIMRKVAERAEPGSYSPLRMAVEVTACNLPFDKAHVRCLGPETGKPLQRRFSESVYDASTAAGERAFHESDDFTLVRGVKHDLPPGLWAVSGLKRTRQVVRLLHESAGLLTRYNAEFATCFAEDNLRRTNSATILTVTHPADPVESPPTDIRSLRDGSDANQFEPPRVSRCAKPKPKRRRGAPSKYPEKEKYWALWKQAWEQERLTKEEFAHRHWKDKDEMKLMLDAARHPPKNSSHNRPR